MISQEEVKEEALMFVSGFKMFFFSLKTDPRPPNSSSDSKKHQDLLQLWCLQSGKIIHIIHFIHFALNKAVTNKRCSLQQVHCSLTTSQVESGPEDCLSYSGRSRWRLKTEQGLLMKNPKRNRVVSVLVVDL